MFQLNSIYIKMQRPMCQNTASNVCLAYNCRHWFSSGQQFKVQKVCLVITHRHSQLVHKCNTSVVSSTLKFKLNHQVEVSKKTTGKKGGMWGGAFPSETAQSSGAAKRNSWIFKFVHLLCPASVFPSLFNSNDCCDKFSST